MSRSYGGYLIWAVPEHPVFLDGRGDVFEWAGVLGDNLQVGDNFKAIPTRFSIKYGINFCLLSRGSPMVGCYVPVARLEGSLFG